MNCFRYVSDVRFFFMTFAQRKDLVRYYKKEELYERKV